MPFACILQVKLDDNGSSVVFTVGGCMNGRVIDSVSAFHLVSTKPMSVLRWFLFTTVTAVLVQQYKRLDQCMIYKRDCNDYRIHYM